MAKPVKPPLERIIKSGLVSPASAPHKPPRLSGKLIFFPDWCKKCGLCTVICPHQALVRGPEGNPELPDQEKCRLCSLCWRICPDFAIIKNPQADGESGGKK